MMEPFDVFLEEQEARVCDYLRDFDERRRVRVMEEEPYTRRDLTLQDVRR